MTKLKSDESYPVGSKGTPDSSHGYTSRDACMKSVEAQVKSGKLNRELRRAAKSLRKKKP